MARRRWSFWMPPLEHGFIRRLDDLYRASLTPLGRALFWGLVAAPVMRMGSLSPSLYTVLSVLAGVMIAAALVAAPFRPAVRLTRRLPPPPSAGDTWSYEVLVENTSRRVLRSVSVQERGLPAELRPVGEPPVIDELAPGEQARVRLVLRCVRRGAYTLGRLQATTHYPAGLVKLGQVYPAPDRLLVYPRFEPLEDFAVPSTAAYQPGGIPVASLVGESMELAGLRPWRSGDRPRDVHWPAYARTGRLVVRERLQEHFVRLALVLDVAARSVADEVHFERGLSVGAAIADALARREHIIDIFAAGERIHRFQAGRALAHVENILELLACLEPGDRLDAAALEAEILPEARQLSAVILVMTTWDAERAQVVGRLRACGVAVRVLCVQPGVVVEGLGPDEWVPLP